MCLKDNTEFVEVIANNVIKNIANNVLQQSRLMVCFKTHNLLYFETIISHVLNTLSAGLKHHTLCALFKHLTCFALHTILDMF